MFDGTRYPLNVSSLLFISALLPNFGGLASPLAAAENSVPERVVRVEAEIKAPQDKVWQTWSTTEGITSFFSPGANIDAKPDGPFEIWFLPNAPAGQRGGDGMRVLAVQPPRMISFTWNAPPSLPEMRKQRTSVVVRLAPIESGSTRVTIVQSGWGDGEEWDKAYDYFSKAWPNVLNNLKTRFEKGPIDWKAARGPK